MIRVFALTDKPLVAAIDEAALDRLYATRVRASDARHAAFMNNIRRDGPGEAARPVSSPSVDRPGRHGDRRNG